MQITAVSVHRYFINSKSSVNGQLGLCWTRSENPYTGVCRDSAHLLSDILPTSLGGSNSIKKKASASSCNLLISTFYMHKGVNMVIVSCLEVMGIFSACRVYFKYFLTKINMSMCFGMLLDPNTLKCDIWSFCSESLIIEKTP